MKQLLNLYAVAPLALLMLASQPAKAGDYGFNYITKGGRIILKDSTMMHEMRQTPSPLNGEVVTARKVSFQWPLPPELSNTTEALDGMDLKPKFKKSLISYKLRYSQDPAFQTGTVERQLLWPMFNPDVDLKEGKWYWQYAFVVSGKETWSERLSFTVGNNPTKFCPPPFSKVVEGLTDVHPRIWVQKSTWDKFIEQAKTKKEYNWYVNRAEKVMKVPMKGLNDINLKKLSSLENEMKRKAYITRESRRIIDAEEGNSMVLVYAYLLTKNEAYAKEATKRIISMSDWNNSSSVAGDFNESTVVSLASMAYDSFYDMLTADERKALLNAVKVGSASMYARYNNHLENHIADNHVWQMTLRILTMAALATYNDLPEANTWAEFCYNIWVSRMPGLNEDGAWHNGDSYFSVNTRTLIEVPWLYSRLTGFDFFSDPWYRGNIMYTMYEQPPFSKSGGNGSTHQKVMEPRSQRIGYLDALARLTGNTYAADFVRRTLAEKRGYLRKSFLAKSGDLSWFRLQCDKSLPKGKGLASLSDGYVFPQSGLAAFQSNWDNYKLNAEWTFRSSPYGSTSHALANQNAFNTFYGGKSLFYSSGHHTSFVDAHSVYCHRGTRAHNTMLVDGMGQRIGTEGYGWIPRYYVGKNIGYVLGDASNAYGEVISTLWQTRAKLTHIEFTPKTGWDKNHVKTYRRHIVDLGDSGLIFVYDELEADKPVAWNYMLHSVTAPITFGKQNKTLHVQTTNEVGASDAYIFAPTELKADTKTKFFVPATNWLKSDAKGRFLPNPDHWHFTASPPKSQFYHFATIVDTHAKDQKPRVPVMHKNGKITVGDWTIEVNIKADGKPFFHVVNSVTKAEATLNDNGTAIKDGDTSTLLVDKLPKLEI